MEFRKAGPPVGSLSGPSDQNGPNRRLSLENFHLSLFPYLLFFFSVRYLF